MGNPFFTLALIDCCGTVQGTYDTTDEAVAAMHGAADFLSPMRIVELVEVVRCGECKQNMERGGDCAAGISDDWFCADGRKRR